MAKLLTEGNNHIFISGMTRSGKTYFALHALSQVRQGVLFINMQSTETPTKFNRAMADQIGIEQIIKGLRAGEKIDLCFPKKWTLKRINFVIGYISAYLLTAGFNEKNYIYIAYDECQALDNEAIKSVRLTCTRGLYLGIRCVFITQRPALADLSFYTQASEQYIFQLGKGERQYFQSKGIDYDECLKIWQEKGPHSYVFTDGFTLKGRDAI